MKNEENMKTEEKDTTMNLVGNHIYTDTELKVFGRKYLLAKSKAEVINWKEIAGAAGDEVYRLTMLNAEIKKVANNEGTRYQTRIDKIKTLLK